MTILNNLFNKVDHLLSQELDYRNYLIFDKHCIDSGSFGNIFLGCLKETKIRIKERKIFYP